ncbi:MAG: alkaline phosphatase family protein, partial [bacterium]
ADSLLVINGKGRGTGPNPGGLRPDQKLVNGDRSYTLGQLDGTITVMPTRIDSSALAALDRRVATANNWLSGGREATSRALHSVMPPIKHVILIIKENRTFDQVLADLPGVDGDTALQFFTRSASPNHHALAERFGAFDHFFTNAEVSSQGHQWSTAAYVTDYIEKTTPAAYSGRRAEPDEAGEVDEPVAGYLWTLALKKGLWFRNYGEYGNPEPDSSHGAVRYHSFLRSLEQSTDQSYPPFDLAVLDQRRVDEWLREFTAFQKSDSMPALETMHLPNDHTAGARAGMHTPRAMFADNDLAVGRIVEAVSRSKFWSSTAIFVLEDDAQAGPDHVDSHRSVLLVASPYARSGAIHRFVNTTDVLATIEELLHLPALSRFDEFAHPLREIWRASADLRPYVALTPSQSLDERNPKRSAMSGASETLDLRNADRIDDAKFNRILWRTIKGTTAYPGVRRVSMLELVRAW